MQCCWTIGALRWSAGTCQSHIKHSKKPVTRSDVSAPAGAAVLLAAALPIRTLCRCCCVSQKFLRSPQSQHVAAQVKSPMCAGTRAAVHGAPPSSGRALACGHCLGDPTGSPRWGCSEQLAKRLMADVSKDISPGAAAWQAASPRRDASFANHSRIRAAKCSAVPLPRAKIL